MAPERWRQIEEMYHAANELHPSQRSAFLAGACAGDEALKHKVESLLAQEAGGRILDVPAAELAGEWSVSQMPSLQGVIAGNPRSLSAGDRLGSFEIIALLGAGGMGEVYQARDLRLRRDVALKVLPAMVSRDRARRERFTREARAIAALNHPHIVTIHGMECAGEADFMVMELIAGNPLDRLIPGKGLPPGEALNYAVQIADALTAAHAAGIVHRDLKPGNVMVTESGTVKVLDFGLAKVLHEAWHDSRDRETPEGRSCTEEGVILGTASYMSPEQVAGKKVDARSDIFSFGALVYQMLSGRRAFPGESTMSTFAAVLSLEPRPIQELAGEIPAGLGQVVERCLRKDPARRAQSMADVRLALEEAGGLVAGGVPARPAARFSRPVVWASAIGALILCAATATGVWWALRRPASVARDRLTVAPLTTDAGYAVCPTFSPDGSQIAYQWDQGRRQPRIFVRLVGPGEPIRLTRGSQAESCPVWSPDGRFVAFVRSEDESNEGIFLVPALGGEERKLAQFPQGIGYYPEFRPHLLSWTPDSRHLIAAMQNASLVSELFLIATDSGEKKPLVAPVRDRRHWDRDPAVSPDGRFLVFTREAGYGASDLRLVELTRDLRAAGAPRQLTAEAARGHYAQTPAWSPDGREVIYSSNREGSPGLWRIGLQRGATPRQLPSVGPDSFLPAVSASGRMVYVRHFRDVNIWRQELSPHAGRLKAPESLIASTAHDGSPQYSPDGSRIAFQSERSGSFEIWICGHDGEHCRQLTSFNGPVTGTPRWSPDGRTIAFDSSATGAFEIYVTAADGGAAKRLTGGGYNVVPSWSSDGKWIYFASPRTGRMEVWKMPASGGTEFQVTRHGGAVAFESPDGRSLYYTKGIGLSSLHRSDPDGAHETEIARDVIARAFAVTRERIFYLHRENQSLSALRSLPVTGTRSSLIAVLTRPLDLGLSVSPDLRYALYPQVDRDGSTLMLVDDFY